MKQLRNSGVVFIENDYERKYLLGDKELSGITGIISKHLFPDEYSKVPAHVLKNASKRGTRIHDDTFTYDMFGTTNSEEARWYADLKEKVGFDVIDNEYLVSDLKHFASAIDKVLLINNKYYLCDMKTTYRLNRPKLSWQLSILKYFFNIINPGIEVAGLTAIWVRDGATFHEIDEVPLDEVERLLECEVSGTKYTRAVMKGEVEALHLIKELSEIASEIKRLDDLKKDYNSRIEKLFKDTGLVSWDNDFFTISKSKDYTRKGFDSKKFEKDNPELYAKYVKDIQVKGSITTKLKMV